MKYLDFYKKCITTGKLPHENGLCDEFGNDEFFNMFEPYAEEHRLLVDEGFCSAYWASGLSVYTNIHRAGFEFSPLRQNIVLLMTCLNGEL